jgi:hypothetical protein
MMGLMARRNRLIYWVILLGWWGVSTAVLHAQTGSGFTYPAEGESVAGVVVIQGTAVHPEFLRYEVAFSHNNGDWVPFADGNQPIQSGTLAIWDTTIGRQSGNPVFPDGAYRLRLRVVRQDYNYDEYFVGGLTLNNSGQQPTPTPNANPAAPSTLPTPPPADSVPTVPAQLPAILPSLTPFPTSTPPATPERGASNPAIAPDNAPPPTGIAGQLAAIDSNRFWQAAQLGIAITLAIFAFLALYLILRAIVRRLWRMAQQKNAG